MFSLKHQKTLFPAVALAIIMASSSLSFSQSAMAHQTEKQPEWMYRGSNGVAHWGGTTPKYSPCADGKYQSPTEQLV